MYNKKVKLRALFLFLSIATLILTIFLVLKALEENVVYFLSPTEIKNLNETTTEKIRVGGMVKDQSIKITSDKINFMILAKHDENYIPPEVKASLGEK